MNTQVDSPRVWGRRVLWLIAGVAVAVVGILVWVGARSSSARADADEDVPLSTAEVVRTDLSQTATYDGTLGRVDGDPITTPAGGTVTAAASPGTLVGEGDVLYEIDGEPAVLLAGDTPAYRPIGPSESATSAGAGSTGTVTWAPQPGDLIEAGDVLFEIDGHPTILMYGDTPMWRDLLSWVSDGPDVEQLEQNLVDLGYDPDETVTIDEDVTSATRSMVGRWQEDIGVDVTGNVAVADVIFLPGAVEVREVLASVGSTVSPGTPVLETGNGVPTSGTDVAQLEAALQRLGFAEGTGMVVDGTYDPGTYQAITAWQSSNGAAPDGTVDLGEVFFAADTLQISERLAPVGSRVGEGTPVLAATGNDIVVQLGLPAADQGLVSPGDAVVVTLPNRTEVAATVDSVAESATASPEGEAVFEVVILLDDPDDAAGLIDAPVDVDVVSSEVADVLAVPVTALLALAEGGYADKLGEAEEHVEAALAANQNSDNHVLTAVALALAIFFSGVSTKLQAPRNRMSAISLSALIFVGAVSVLILLPKISPF